jgi:hypothetical protein
MSVRGKRSHSHIRRLAAALVPRPLATGRGAPEAASVSIASADRPEAEADALIAAFLVRAYSEARRRQRQARAWETAAHWGYVARIIALRTGAAPGAEPPLRRAMDANLTSDRETSPARLPEPFSGIRQLDELERILNAKPQQFRLQFFAVAGDHGPTIVAETVIPASDSSSAIRAAADEPWPAQAIGLRILDPEGREIFEQLKADRR